MPACKFWACSTPVTGRCARSSRPTCTSRHAWSPIDVLVRYLAPVKLHDHHNRERHSFPRGRNARKQGIHYRVVSKMHYELIDELIVADGSREVRG